MFAHQVSQVLFGMTGIHFPIEALAIFLAAVVFVAFYALGVLPMQMTFLIAKEAEEVSWLKGLRYSQFRTVVLILTWIVFLVAVTSMYGWRHTENLYKSPWVYVPVALMLLSSLATLYRGHRNFVFATALTVALIASTNVICAQIVAKEVERSVEAREGAERYAWDRHRIVEEAAISVRFTFAEVDKIGPTLALDDQRVAVWREHYVYLLFHILGHCDRSRECGDRVQALQNGAKILEKVMAAEGWEGITDSLKRKLDIIRKRVDRLLGK